MMRVCSSLMLVALERVQRFPATNRCPAKSPSITSFDRSLFMATSSTSFGGSSVNNLPAEVLSLIFAIVVDSSKDNTYRLRRGRKFLPSCALLTHVCRYWREVALNCSALWTRINFMSVKCAQEMLTRAKDAPLKVFATLEDHWQQPTVPIKAIHVALQQLSRIKELEITHNGKDLNALVQTMASPAPLLERMSLQATTSGRGLEYLTESAFAGIAPRLRFLSLTQCSLAKWDLPIFRNLVDFEVYDVSTSRRPDIAGYLGTCSCLHRRAVPLLKTHPNS